MRELSLSIAGEADHLFGGTPLRISYRVSIKKPRAYYQAAEEAVRLLLDRQYLLTNSTQDLWAELDTRVKTAYGPDAEINKSYWYKTLTDGQVKQIQVLMRWHAFDPKVHTQLNLIADLIRSGPVVNSMDAAVPPTGGESTNGTVKFIGEKQVILCGVQRAIRWRRGKPYVRNMDGTEDNLYTLLQGMGIGQEIAAAWVKNAIDREQKLLDQAARVRQRKALEKSLDAHMILDADVIPAIVNNFRSSRAHVSCVNR